MDQTNSIRLFRPGTFTSMEGKKISFSASDLAAIAASYDPDADAAPLVIGHPKLDDPAYGWVGSLAVENGELVATPDKIAPAFAETVRDGSYAKVSAQFYDPQDPNNPKPGGFYLKHIGFLGAHAAGVKGLGRVSFADGSDDATVTIEMEKPEMPDPKTTAADDAAQAASFAERQSDLDEREQKIADREKAAVETARKDRHSSHVSFAEGLVNDAVLAPAAKDAVIGILDQLGEADATGGTVSFGEGEDAGTGVAAFKKLFEGATPLISLGEEAAADKKGSGKALASFAAPQGYEVEPDQAAIYARAKALQAENSDLSFDDAVDRAAAA